MREIEPTSNAEMALDGIIPLPERWSQFSVAQVAEAVHDEVRHKHSSFPYVIIYLYC